MASETNVNQSARHQQLLARLPPDEQEAFGQFSLEGLEAVMEALAKRDARADAEAEARAAAEAAARAAAEADEVNVAHEVQQALLLSSLVQGQNWLVYREVPGTAPPYGTSPDVRVWAQSVLAKLESIAGDEALSVLNRARLVAATFYDDDDRPAGGGAFLCLPLSSGASAMVDVCVVLWCPWRRRGSVLAIKISHLAEDNPKSRSGVELMRHELNALLAVRRIDGPLHHEAAAAAAIMGTALPGKDRFALFFPLGVPLKQWWPAVASRLSDDSARDSVLSHVASSVLSSLQLLHGLSVVHCDIKASNVIMLPPAPDDLASVDDWATAPLQWRACLHDLGGADFDDEFISLPPQPVCGGPRRKRAVAEHSGSWGPWPVDDVESFVIMVLGLMQHPAADLWRTADTVPTAAELQAMPTGDVLWRLDLDTDEAPGPWYEAARAEVAQSALYSTDEYPFARRAWLDSVALQSDQGRVASEPQNPDRVKAAGVPTRGWGSVLGAVLAGLAALAAWAAFKM